jgi:hypothetical protein
MASPNEPPNQDILARSVITFEARKRFQDYVIAFEWYRTLDERCRRGDPVEEELATAAVSLDLAHNAWRETVIGGVSRTRSSYRPTAD